VEDEVASLPPHRRHRPGPNNLLDVRLDLVFAAESSGLFGDDSVAIDIERHRQIVHTLRRISLLDLPIGQQDWVGDAGLMRNLRDGILTRVDIVSKAKKWD